MSRFIDTGRPSFDVSPSDTLGLLAVIGEDCPGAIQLVRPERGAAVLRDDRMLFGGAPSHLLLPGGGEVALRESMASEDESMLERYTMSEDETRLHYEIVITDPEYLAEPAIWDHA